MSIASAAGAMSAEPAPWRARPARSTESEDARPVISEAPPRMAKPAMKTRRAPYRSASRPPSRRRPPNAMTYALKTHERSGCENWRARWTSGRATPMIEVALPEVQRALQFSQPDLSWVFNAYVIAFGGLLLLGGRLADLYGARRVFMAGFAILGGASLITGLAPSDSVLLAGRALQGAGSALIAPAALTMLMTLFSHDPRELTKALALYGAAAPAGGTAGVFLGGVLTSSLDWRWVFLVNVPVAIVVLAASRGILPAGLGRPGRLDIRGAVAVTAALSLAVFGIVRGPIVGWAATETIGALAAAAAFFAIFVRLQSRAREPLMRLGIWRAPNLAAANISMALLGAAWIPTWFFLNLYLQQVLGFGPFEAGLALVPMTLTIMVLMVAVTGRVVGRFGFKRPVIAGIVILAGAT